MNFKRIGRALICLILVCALLVNISPIRAEAFVIESVLVNAGMVALSCILGLGVGFQTYEIAMPYIDDCVSYLKSIDYVNAAEQIAIYSAGTQQYYANQTLVEVVRDWLFSSGTVVGNELPSIDSILTKYKDIKPYAVIYYSTYYEKYIFQLASEPFLVVHHSEEDLDSLSDCFLGVDSSSHYAATYRLDSDGTWSQYDSQEITLRRGPTFSLISSVVWANHDIHHVVESAGEYSYRHVFVYGSESSSISSFSVVDGLVASQIASKDEDFTTGYSSWAANSISIPGQLEDNEPIIGLPLGLGSNLSDMIGLTQSDVWNGTSTYIPDEETESTEPSIGVIPGSLADADAEGFLGSIADYLMDAFAWLWSKIEAFFGPWIDRIEGWFSDAITAVETIPDAFSGWFADIIGGIVSIPESIADVFGGVIDGVIALPGTIADVFADVIAGVIALPQTIADAIADAATALFVPAEGYIETKVEALTSKFPFAKVISDSSLEMKKFLLNLGQQPPIIYIDLGAATGSYIWGGRTIFIDLTWYAQYKGTMDVIISSFLWLWFVWRMTLALPGIIQGTSGFWTKPDVPNESTSLTITGDSSHYFRR